MLVQKYSKHIPRSLNLSSPGHLNLIYETGITLEQDPSVCALHSGFLKHICQLTAFAWLDLEFRSSAHVQSLSEFYIETNTQKHIHKNKTTV